MSKFNPLTAPWDSNFKRAIILTCDKSMCNRVFHYTDNFHNYLGKSPNELAFDAGWRRVDDKIYCLRHRSTPPEQESDK